MCFFIDIIVFQGILCYNNPKNNTQYQEDIVDMFLENLLLDKGFAEWINTRRYKKKIEAILNECKLVDTMESELYLSNQSTLFIIRVAWFQIQLLCIIQISFIRYVKVISILISIQCTLNIL